MTTVLAQVAYASVLVYFPFCTFELQQIRLDFFHNSFFYQSREICITRSGGKHLRNSFGISPPHLIVFFGRVECVGISIDLDRAKKGVSFTKGEIVKDWFAQMPGLIVRKDS